jgi:excisionase family DNA binding protein
MRCLVASDTRSPPRPEVSPVSPLLVDLVTAAAMLSISERLLHAKVKAGEVPHVRIGNRVLFSPAALDAWIANGCQSTAPAKTN